jgi:6-pyruvoyltetrahydropterin/6-carboxytetrahydropterin synthase
MYIIRKEFSFSASHQLMGLTQEHPCSNLHGHNYTVVVELRSKELNKIGFVFDYRGFQPIKSWIDGQLDHRNLNDILDFNPTAENIAKYIFNKITDICENDIYIHLFAVEVSETPKTSARYERD